MSRSTRTDAFRPSVINAAEFEFVADHYLGNSDDSDMWTELAHEYANYEAHIARTGGVEANHGYKGRCDVCGAKYLYGSWFHTAASNTYIAVGHDCAAKMGLRSEAAFRPFREQVNTHRIHAKRVEAARVLLATHELGDALALYLNPATELKSEEKVIIDIIGKCVRWGSISPNQVQYIKKLQGKIVERPAREAARVERDAQREPIPAFLKRVNIVGTVISVKEVEGFDAAPWSRWSSPPKAYKMLVEHADGWRVYGSVPSNIDHEGLKGKRVRFDARVTVSDDDPKFGFFSRPTKASIETVTPVTDAGSVAA